MPRPKTMPMEPTWKDNLRRYSLKVGFTLHLTRAMLEMLCAIADDVQWDRSIYRLGAKAQDTWLSTTGALVKRGLIEKKDDGERKAHYQSVVTGQVDEEKQDEWSIYLLTPAGKSVIQLVKLAGVFVEADKAINKKARRA